MEVGGPEALGVDAWARRLFSATGDDRTVIADPHAPYYGAELGERTLVPAAGARLAETRFAHWLDEPTPKPTTGSVSA